MDIAAIEEAVHGLRPALEEDGFALRVGSVTDTGEVEVVLEAKTGACLDCLVPDDVMVQILQQAILEQEPGVAGVRLVRVGFEALDGH